jgi:hypothetical protein
VNHPNIDLSEFSLNEHENHDWDGSDGDGKHEQVDDTKDGDSDIDWDSESL